MPILIAFGGLTLLTLLVVQILVGSHVIKIDFKYHKPLAYILLALGVLHGAAGLIYLFG